jgi:hypothetical protein
VSTPAMPILPPLTPKLGAFLGPADVRRAVLSTLSAWSATYLWEAKRRTDHLDLEDPLATSFDGWVNEPGVSAVNPGMTPRYVVSVPGSLGTPRRAGDGTYRATWRVVVDLWLYGPDYQTTEDLLGWYVAALRECLVQHGALGGIAEHTEWLAEAYAPAAPPTAFHSWGRASLTLGVTIDGMMSAYTAPATPPTNPIAEPAGLPRVSNTKITVTTIPPGGTL